MGKRNEKDGNIANKLLFIWADPIEGFIEKNYVFSN